MYGEDIPIRNIVRRIKDDRFDSIDEINEAVDSCISHIESKRALLLSTFSKLTECEHEYGNPTYTVQRRLFTYVTVYERKCVKCGQRESFQQNDKDGDDVLPTWTKGATRTHYNNDI